jgi:hypothetical protein
MTAVDMFGTIAFVLWVVGMLMLLVERGRR